MLALVQTAQSKHDRTVDEAMPRLRPLEIRDQAAIVRDVDVEEIRGQATDRVEDGRGCVAERDVEDSVRIRARIAERGAASQHALMRAVQTADLPRPGFL